MLCDVGWFKTVLEPDQLNLGAQMLSWDAEILNYALYIYAQNEDLRHLNCKLMASMNRRDDYSQMNLKKKKCWNYPLTLH